MFKATHAYALRGTTETREFANGIERRVMQQRKRKARDRQIAAGEAIEMNGAAFTTRSVELSQERVAKFLVEHDDASFEYDADLDACFLIVPDAETAALARLSL